MTDMVERAAAVIWDEWNNADEPYDPVCRLGQAARSTAQTALLVALDPEDAEAVARVWRPWMFDEADPMHKFREHERQTAIRNIREFIESLRTIAQGVSDGNG